MTGSTASSNQDRSGQADHDAPFKAPITAAIVAGDAPSQIRTMTPSAPLRSSSSHATAGATWTRTASALCDHRLRHDNRKNEGLRLRASEVAGVGEGT
jgi:hypothetical protein